MKRPAEFAVVVILVLLGLYLMLGPQSASIGSNANPNGQSNQSSYKTLSPAQLDQRIESEMKAGRFSEELRRDQTAVENEISATRPRPEALDPLVYSKEKEPIRIIFNSEDGAAKAQRDQQANDPNQRYMALTPEQRITKKINRDEFAREAERLQEAAFMEQYRENARKAGYDVRFNKEGEIVYYQYVGQPEAARFPQSEGKAAPAATGAPQQSSGQSAR